MGRRRRIHRSEYLATIGKTDDVNERIPTILLIINTSRLYLECTRPHYHLATHVPGP